MTFGSSPGTTNRELYNKTKQEAIEKAIESQSENKPDKKKKGMLKMFQKGGKKNKHKKGSFPDQRRKKGSSLLENVDDEDSIYILGVSVHFMIVHVYSILLLRFHYVARKAATIPAARADPNATRLRRVFFSLLDFLSLVATFQSWTSVRNFPLVTVSLQ